MTIDTALFSDALPCNPRPFARAIEEGCQDNGTDWIRTSSAKRILWVLLAQSYGQLATVDLCEEWSRLRRSYNRVGADGPCPDCGCCGYHLEDCNPPDSDSNPANYLGLGES